MLEAAPRVIEQNNAHGGVSYWQGTGNQSVADANGVSLAEYIHALYGLLRQAGAKNVLMIGCGGTLGTMLARKGVKVTMVDIDALPFEIARRYFRLPAKVRCVVADGGAFLKAGGPRYDAIILDAFMGEKIPPHFIKRVFFERVKARLTARGIFLINIIVADDEDRTPDRIGWRLKTVWRNARLLDSDGYVDRNAIAMAGSVTKLKPPRLMMKPKTEARSIAADLKALDFRELRT